MRLKTVRQGRTIVAHLAGELDQHSSEQVRDELDGILDDESVKRIEFDLKDVTFMDSSGIGVILGRYKRLKPRGGSMGVMNAKPGIDRILRMSGVYRIATERSRA